MTWSGKAIKNTFKAFTGQRAVFMVGGLLARGGATLAGIASYAVFPIAGVLGGARGWFRKSKEIRERTKQARLGVIGTDTIGKDLLANFRGLSEKVTKNITGDDGQVTHIERDTGLTAK